VIRGADDRPLQQAGVQVFEPDPSAKTGGGGGDSVDSGYSGYSGGGGANGERVLARAVTSLSGEVRAAPVVAPLQRLSRTALSECSFQPREPLERAVRLCAAPVLATDTLTADLEHLLSTGR
jgi:hypothetical protein